MASKLSSKTTQANHQETPSLMPSGLAPDLPPDAYRLETSRFRKRDSLGALRPRKAALDAADAQGYARGVEETLAELVERLRDILVSIIERRHGELSEEQCLKVERASEGEIEHWLHNTADSTCIDDVFR